MTSTTPVADALQVVDDNRAELMRVLRSALGQCGEGDVSSERDAYLGALENLADAVRSHGIGAELAARRLPELECAWCGKPATLDGCTVCDCTAIRRARVPQQVPRYEHAHCTGCGAWYLAGHGPGCRVGAAERVGVAYVPPL